MSWHREIWRGVKQGFSIEQDNPLLLKAQYKAFSTQLPLMYFILLVNSWILSSTHIDSAPHWLTLDYPAILTVVCFIRFIFWLRSRNRDPTDETARQTLKRTSLIAAPIALSFTVWAILLFPYGNAYQQSHVAFYMGITVIGCIFCLMHLRSAALITTAVVNTSFVIFFASTGKPTFIATSLNVAMVSATMLIILHIYYRDFKHLIDAQAQAEALSNENFHLANMDSLTMLPNRRKFFTELKACCTQAANKGSRFVLGILDLDGFKPVNDLYGHSIGDKLLFTAGKRIQQLCDEHTHLARLGGDEFALIITRPGNNEALLAFGNRVCNSLRQPFTIAGNSIHISASIGLATYPDMASNATELFEHADYALYHGKRNNRSKVTLFSASHRNLIQQEASIEQALRKADFEQELEVYFQPIINLETGKTAAFEALARWHSPILGPVSPAQFIPIAERTGIINKQTRILLGKALATAAKWPADIRLSFNLSVHDLSSRSIVERLVSLIKQANFDPQRLDMEITETAIIRDLDQAKWATEKLRKLGCGISLDDFGTGYSSLNQLHALSLTKIKIDRSFVTGIEQNLASLKIVKSLLALSRDMGLDCIIEGVETQAELQVIREIGGIMVQGYFYSSPIPETAIPSWLADRPALLSQ
ncbi:EAL domain-containing protein [Methylobacillus arboreus]|uniref:putative bifunctional diguanylate cyclase/phosphodiesterase n=1 Tax=Methylobacillus arboreus TaxID=755170 RepID=UPI001E348833|nr:EAL domain-containing protein [Methylobacillus arboreus]MCB5189468.1 EAL domain-containing protein [Methylobacillus arboreus]